MEEIQPRNAVPAFIYLWKPRFMSHVTRSHAVRSIELNAAIITANGRQREKGINKIPLALLCRLSPPLHARVNYQMLIRVTCAGRAAICTLSEKSAIVGQLTRVTRHLRLL